MPRTIEERYVLTDQDADTKGTNTTADVMSDAWDYQVPVGIRHVLLPEHHVSMSLHDTGAGTPAIADTALVQIEVRDSAGQSKETIFGPTIYKRVQEFQDRELMATLELAEPLKLEEGDHIVVMVKDDVGVAVSDAESYFALETQRVRTGVGR